MASSAWLMSLVILSHLGVHGVILRGPATSQSLVNSIDARNLGNGLQFPNVCYTPSPGVVNLSSGELSWIPELPPHGFAVDFKYTTRLRDLDKFSVWLGLLLNMGRVGIHGWDLRLTGQLKFPESHNFALNALSSTTPPQFQTKSVLWTLREAFEEYVDREQYSSAALTARLDGRPLGFATIKSTLAQGQAADSFTSSPSPFPHLGRRGLDVRLDYVPNGVSFTDVGLFRTMIHLLVWAANHDPKSVGSGKLGIYNNVEDYTFEMGPMDEESVDELVLVRVIQVLGTLPAAMYHEQRGGRWAELKGVIKFDGVNIGRIKLEKGQHVHCTHSNGTATS